LKSLVKSCLLLVFLLHLTQNSSALRASSPQEPEAEPFVASKAMIPMRDGVKLHTRIFVPKQKTGPLPFILVRTPYGTQNAAQNFASYLKDLADDGYIFVFQDIRGKFESEGTFMMQRPARRQGDSQKKTSMCTAVNSASRRMARSRSGV